MIYKIKELLFRLVFPGFYRELMELDRYNDELAKDYYPLRNKYNELMSQYIAQNCALLDCYQALDKIALRDDVPSKELAKLAYDVIAKHKIYRTTKEF